ncbi:MAG TPA: hypothetical protein EYH30_04900 [Anaerolineales bacterium]|nr:hypothetical protein [Anaerolineae bacterium]HIQ01453.1 hypothetical protein [Anaerolineales bacterium]
MSRGKRDLLIAFGLVALLTLSCKAITDGEPPPIGTPAPPPPSGGPLLQDDFSDPGSGWEIGDYSGGSVGYAEGAYFVTATEAGSLMWGLAYRDFSDLVIEVDAIQVSAPPNDNNSYGVMCRVQADDDGYLLRISGDGYYAIHRIVGGEFEPLVDWTTSDAIRQGNATNHLRVVCDGTHLALVVNGRLLAEVEDATYTSGDIALTATTFEEEPTEVRFDNLVVTAP